MVGGWLVGLLASLLDCLRVVLVGSAGISAVFEALVCVCVWVFFFSYSASSIIFVFGVCFALVREKHCLFFAWPDRQDEPNRCRQG